ncbi:hypothetical protein R3P38DRAFT_3041767 [Favolaschia claudopus]|uniref:Uncharacterized protein n=1 Tax=Favolaschia claudopus TaxID=2862362 RepID=A0AAW0A8W1_9AGAR
MFFRLRALYHDIRHIMNLNSLPPPSPMSPTMAATFFPITDENRHQPLKLSAALSHIPFAVYTSLVLQAQMVASGDACENLRITQVQYFQRDVAPLHEYIVYSFEDTRKSGVTNYMLVERWGTDFQPPDKTKEKITLHTIEAPADGTSIAEPITTSPTNEGRTPLMAVAARHSMEASKKRTTSVADDRIIISLRRDPLHINKIEPGTSTLLATITAPEQSQISVAHVLSLASFVSKHSPNYDLLESNCYYYGRAIFDVTRTIMGCEESDVVTAPSFRFMRSDALQWQLTHKVKGLMAEKAKRVFSAEGVRQRFEAAFSEFVENVRQQQEVNNRPLVEQTLARRHAEAALATSEAALATSEAALATSEAALETSEAARELAEGEVARLKKLLAQVEAPAATSQRSSSCI